MANIAAVLRRIENSTSAWNLDTHNHHGDKSGEALQRRRQMKLRKQQLRQNTIDGSAKQRASSAARVVAEQHRRAEEVQAFDERYSKGRHISDRDDFEKVCREAGGLTTPEFRLFTPRGTVSDRHIKQTVTNSHIRTASAPSRMSPGQSRGRQSGQGRLIRPVETVVMARKGDAFISLTSSVSFASIESARQTSAVVVLQAFFRGWFVRCFVVDVDLHRLAAVIIQKRWRLWTRWRITSEFKPGVHGGLKKKNSNTGSERETGGEDTRQDISVMSLLHFKDLH